MNWEIIWTALGLGIVGILLSPLYFAMLIAYKKAIFRESFNLQIAHEMHHDNMAFDSAIQDMLKEGE